MSRPPWGLRGIRQKAPVPRATPTEGQASAGHVREEWDRGERQLEYFDLETFVKILVTGATGFVGPNVANAIVDAGHEVRVLERKAGSWSKAGIRCQEAVQETWPTQRPRRAVADRDVVVHLVAIRQGRKEEFQRVMIQGTRSLIRESKEAGVRRVVLMSALGVSEESISSLLQREVDPGSGPPRLGPGARDLQAELHLRERAASCRRSASSPASRR